MQLCQVHAFTVDPSRTIEEDMLPVGGAIPITTELVRALQRNVAAAKFNERALVDFQVDSNTRTNAIRDAILRYAFGNDDESSEAASTLAAHLSQAMDFRSKPNLFVLTALHDGARRRVILWTFPRDEAFQFVAGQDGPSLQVLTDIFSQTSRLRKAAMFEGRQLRNSFLSGRVLDFQTSHASLDIAAFWIERFLQCTFGLAGDAGTRLLADAFRNGIDASEDPSDREQLLATMMALRHIPRRRWSLQEIAETYLSEDLGRVFLSSVPNQATRVATFELQRDVMDRILRFRIFQLDTGVYVSSPLDEVGQSVSIEGEVERRLICEGTILDEKVRSRHG